MNKNHSTDIKKLHYNNCSLLNDSWLSGFIDAYGKFYIRNSLRQIICKFSLEQHQPNGTQESFNRVTSLRVRTAILEQICASLNVKLYKRSRKNNINSYYIIRVENQSSIKILIDYLDKYPLLSSKYLDFLC
jgi:hypothetical protein